MAYEISGKSTLLIAGRLRKRLPENGRLTEQMEYIRTRLDKTPICQARPPRFVLLVMVTCLEKINTIICNQIDNPVLLC
jgi:hypothetical protein